MPTSDGFPDDAQAFMDGINARNGMPASLIVCAMVGATTLGQLVAFGPGDAPNVVGLALGALVTLASLCMGVLCGRASGDVVDHREAGATPGVASGATGGRVGPEGLAGSSLGPSHRTVRAYLALALVCLTARLFLTSLPRLALAEYAIAVLLLVGTFLLSPNEWAGPLIVSFCPSLIYALGDMGAGRGYLGAGGALVVSRVGVVSAVVVCALYAAAVALAVARFRTALHAWERDALLSRQYDELERQQAELRQLNRNLADDATHDELTGLLERTALRGRFDGYVGRPLVCAIVDVDHFKEFNDSYGHDVGDRVLREVAHELAEAFGRAADVYRYGGDEFMVFAPQMMLAEFLGRAQALRVALRGPADADGVPRPTVSIGYVHGTPANGGDLRCMIRAMDTKLYETKAHGRDGIHGVRFTTQEALMAQVAAAASGLAGAPDPDATWTVGEPAEPREMAGYCGRTDEVTGLLNITAFRKEVLRRVEAAEAAGPFPAHCFVYLDIDRFDRYLDERGEQAGDDLLRYVGACVSNSFGDGVTSRFANDHFVAFVPAEGVMTRIETLRRVARRRDQTDVKAGVCFYRGSKDVSVGIAWDRARQAARRIRHAEGVGVAVWEASPSSDDRN